MGKDAICAWGISSIAGVEVGAGGQGRTLGKLELDGPPPHLPNVKEEATEEEEWEVGVGDEGAG